MVACSHSLLLKWRLVRRFSLRRDPSNMPSLTILPVEQGRVSGNTVLVPSQYLFYFECIGVEVRETYIPDDHGAGPPAGTALDVLREGNVVVEELQEEVGLFFLVANDVAGDCLHG